MANKNWHGLQTQWWKGFRHLRTSSSYSKFQCHRVRCKPELDSIQKFGSGIYVWFASNTNKSSKYKTCSLKFVVFKLIPSLQNKQVITHKKKLVYYNSYVQTTRQKYHTTPCLWATTSALEPTSRMLSHVLAFPLFSSSCIPFFRTSIWSLHDFIKILTWRGSTLVNKRDCFS